MNAVRPKGPVTWAAVGRWVKVHTPKVPLKCPPDLGINRLSVDAMKADQKVVTWSLPEPVVNPATRVGGVGRVLCSN